MRASWFFKVTAIAAGLLGAAVGPVRSSAPSAATPAAAPVPDLEFQRVSLEEGISHNLIYAIHQDRAGFLWFGTMYGLVRYDGRQYVAYRHDPEDPATLSTDDIVCIAEDAAGDLWVGTFGGGVNRLDPGTGEVQRFLSSGPDSSRLSDGVIWDLACAPDGTVWVGTRGGLDRIDPDTGRVTRFVADPDDPRSAPAGPVQAVSMDAGGILWVGSDGDGLARRDSDGAFTHFRHNPDDATSLPSDRVTDLELDPDGSLWLATQGEGVVHFDPARGVFRSMLPEDAPDRRLAAFVNCLWRDADGTVWAGTWRGIDRLDPATGVRRIWVHDPNDPTSLSGPAVVALCRDRSGVLWVGSYRSGLNRVVPPGTRFPRYGREFSGPRGPSHRIVNAFAEAEDGTLWIATGGGLIAREGPAGGYRHYLHDRNDPHSVPGWTVGDVLVDTEQRVWAGTSFGLARYEPDADHFTVWPSAPAVPGTGPSGPVTTLFEDRAGDLWIGTSAGLDRMNRADGTFESFAHDAADAGSLPENTVLSIHEDSKGRLWVGTYAGLARMDPDRTAFTRFPLDPEDPASLGNSYVYAIHPAAGGSLWIGTAGGLDRWNEATETFTHHDRIGLPNNVITGILEDSADALWISTNRGLARYDGTTPGGAADVWDTADGLQSNLFNPGAALKLRDGSLLFGGVEGYNVVRPELLRPNGTAPPVALSGFYVRGSGRDSLVSRAVEPVVLDHRNGFFTVEFAALDFRRPHRNRYRYRLEGLDEGWIDAGTEGRATYAGVPPGKYVFHATGSNGDGVWNEQGFSLPVTVTPPFWKTLPFAAAVVAALALLAWSIHRARVRSRVQRTLEIERARADERDLVRRRTADDFHDELGHRLTKIGLFSEVVRRELRDLSPEADRWLSRIVQESRQLSDDARDFVWSIGPGGETLLDLMNYLNRFGEELFDRTEVEFHTEGITPELGNVRLAMESRRHICSIFKEAMNNALRHSGGEHVRLQVRLVGDEFEIGLADDGRGYTRTSIRAGNGLKSMELRAQKIAGRIQIASRPGSGSTITLNRRAVAPTSADDPSLARRGR